MRHEPNASLQLHSRCIQDGRKWKSRSNDGLDGQRRKRIEYRIDMHAPLSASTDRLRRRHEWDPVAGLGASFEFMIYVLSLYHPCYHNTRLAATLQSNLLPTASTVARVCRVQMSCQSRIVSQELPATPAIRRLDSAMGCLHDPSVLLLVFLSPLLLHHLIESVSLESVDVDVLSMSAMNQPVVCADAFDEGCRDPQPPNPASNIDVVLS
jgi:hypothetical protein